MGQLVSREKEVDYDYKTVSDVAKSKKESKSEKGFQCPFRARFAKVTPEDAAGSDRLTKHFNCQCTSRSWLEILSSSEKAADGSVAVHGMTLFQKAFFKNLRTLDPDGKVYGLLDLCQHKSNSSNKSASHVLMIIVRFIATVKNNSRQMTKRLAELGRRHQRLNITRAHMIIFVDALLLTVSDRLGSLCVPSVLSAWKDVSMFCVDSMYKTRYLFFSLHSSSSYIDTEGSLITIRPGEDSNSKGNLRLICDRGANFEEIPTEVRCESQPPVLNSDHLSTSGGDEGEAGTAAKTKYGAHCLKPREEAELNKMVIKEIRFL